MNYRNDSVDNDFFGQIGDETDYVDIDATVEAIREAWRCAPGVSLSELLDMVTPMPFCELKNEELISELNEFILQNHKQ